MIKCIFTHHIFKHIEIMDTIDIQLLSLHG